MEMCTFLLIMFTLGILTEFILGVFFLNAEEVLWSIGGDYLN